MGKIERQKCHFVMKFLKCRIEIDKNIYTKWKYYFSTEKAESEVPQTTAKIIKRKTVDIQPIK